MREVKTVFWCDWHMKTEGVRVSAEPDPRIVQVDGFEAELDLCPDCDRKLLSPVRELLEAIKSRARKVEQPHLPHMPKPPKPPKPLESPEPEGDKAPQRAVSQCPLCGTWMDQRSRTTHARKKHPQIPPSKLEWRFHASVPEVWVCGCGMPFSTLRSRAKHADRRVSVECALPLSTDPIPPLRPV